MAQFIPEKLNEIDIEFLKKPYTFVFPENMYKIHRENKLFDHLNEWTNGIPFPVRKGPNVYKGIMDTYFTEEEYLPIFNTHLFILRMTQEKTSKINRPIYVFKLDIDINLWEKIIKPNFEKEFELCDNVYFLWEK